MIGRLGIALLALWSPYALTFGEVQTGHVPEVRIGAGVLAVAIVAQLLATSLTVSSGWPGGFIIPLFFAGRDSRPAHAPRVRGRAGRCRVRGIHLLPTTLLAAVIALVLTSEVGLIHSQRARTARAGTER